ncbi:Hypothetical predicted protein [Octopus vulgaris]|uniref:Uncharacterized protein n=1 Tax=Octopus vulgaris TaxID=6645 RepID=A0AA36BFT9_OCTVU|nr:Hypothetical predicted protein [Octopus vulgaris]
MSNPKSNLIRLIKKKKKSNCGETTFHFASNTDSLGVDVIRYYILIHRHYGELRTKRLSFISNHVDFHNSIADYDKRYCSTFH